MSFIAKNPLMATEVESPSRVPKPGMRGIFAGKDGWYEIDSDNKVKKIATTEDIGSGGAVNQIQADWEQIDKTKADFIKNKPTLGALASKDKVTESDLDFEISGGADPAILEEINSIHATLSEYEEIILSLNDVAPQETIPSICDFTLIPTTMQAAYSLANTSFMNESGVFRGKEVPLLTTTGNLVVKDSNGNIKYKKYIDSLINHHNVSDTLTEKGVYKAWSGKFYLNMSPVSKTLASDYSSTKNVTWTWEFTEEDFLNTGIPAKLSNIPVASPCFYSGTDAQAYINDRVYFSQPFPMKFSYDATTQKYTITAKGVYDSIDALLTVYSKVYIYYQLEAPYTVADTFALGVAPGDSITFEEDYTKFQEFIDISGTYRSGATGKVISEYSIVPQVQVAVPRSVTDAMNSMNNIARMLNQDTVIGNTELSQGYSWIGEGDGVTDYYTQLQNKLNELHNVSNGGIVHLGSGTYPISKSLIIYSNTQIVGNGQTIIEQTSDNTHALIWNGSNIHMSDLTIKLSGACTEITACIFVNSNNFSTENMDQNYPENAYVQYCSTSNITLLGTYDFSWQDNYVYVSEETLAYRGVGIYSTKLYFNYYDCDNLICRHLYAGVYGGGGSNNYEMYVTESRIALYDQSSGNSIYNIHGHTYHGQGADGAISATDYVVYADYSHYNTYNVAFYDRQYAKAVLYFNNNTMANNYSVQTMLASMGNGQSSTASDHAGVVDHGRGNINIQTTKEEFFGIGAALWTTSELPYWNSQFNPSVHNALSGAGVWGNITSNSEWEANGIELSDVCRYPKETHAEYFGLASVISKAAPTEENPLEIIIDISDRPISNYKGFWIQFDHRYVAEDYTVSLDTNNDGTFNAATYPVVRNVTPISYRIPYQEPSMMVYRIKISITKALQIPELTYQTADHAEYIINYNPDGLVGIVNIGMPQNEAYGRAFLGECGGNVYGDILLNKYSTIKNVPMPTNDTDVASKIYADTIACSKVDKEEGKGLSTNDFTDEYKDKLNATTNTMYCATDYGISTEAEDNTPALQSLVDTLSENGGGIIFFPVGIYNFMRQSSSDYRWAVEMKSNVSIIGENIEKTILKQTQETPYSMFGRILPDHGGAENPLIGCTFSNFTIDAYATGDVNHVCGKAFFFQYVRDCVFRDLRLMGTTATAMGIDFIDKVVIDNVTCIDCGRTFTGTEAGTSGIGIGTAGWENENFIITNCVCEGCGQYGIFIENQGIFYDGDVDYSKGCVISNCVVRNGINKGIGVRGGQNVTVIGCESYENASHGIFIDNNCKNVKIISCSVAENGGSGIYITPNDSEHLLIKSCTVVNNSAEGIKVSVDAGSNADKLCISECYTDGNTIGIDLSASQLLDCVILGNATLDGINNNTTFTGNTAFNNLVNIIEPAVQEIEITKSILVYGKKLMPFNVTSGHYGEIVDGGDTWQATEQFIDVTSLDDELELYYDTYLGSSGIVCRVVQYSEDIEPSSSNYSMVIGADNLTGETDQSTYHRWKFTKKEGCKYIRICFQYGVEKIRESVGILRSSQLGDIEATLSYILEVQNSYIGGEAQ